MAGAGGAGGFVGAEHGRVVFGVGGATATARLVAFVPGRRGMDDDFRTIRICGGMFVVSAAEFGGSGAAKATDANRGVLGGGDQCWVAVVQRASERVAGEIFDWREPGVCVSAEFEGDGNVVPEAAGNGVGNVGWRVDAGIGGAAFVEWAGRIGLACGDCGDFSADVDWRVCGGVWNGERALPLSAGAV